MQAAAADLDAGTCGGGLGNGMLVAATDLDAGTGSGHLRGRLPCLQVDWSAAMTDSNSWHTMNLPARPDVIAPDGSEIRLLPGPECAAASLVHCRLPAGATAKAISHRTVEEVWLVIAGRGELWRAHGTVAEVTALAPGVAVTIPLGTRFQFRALGSAPLEIVIATFPPWPGAAEAVREVAHWPA